ncbi:uncharacterized protein [Capricornis sumatraensis]|uniref:uncharacterized protein isoform X2 n=1 Tax=Capricornis sumatraensis TaxID=34865 RepID=UPI003604C509
MWSEEPGVDQRQPCVHRLSAAARGMPRRCRRCVSRGSWKPSRVSDPHLTALLKPTQPDPGPSLQTRCSSSSSRSERPEWTLTVNGTMRRFPCAVFRTVDERPSATQAPEVARVLPPTSALRVGQRVPWADHQREPAASPGRH